MDTSTGNESKRTETNVGPTGPRTDKGKFRSALNAVRHGLAGTHILLPGEDADEYVRRIDTVFMDLNPESEFQAQVVALIADDLWKLERLEKIEKGIILSKVEESLRLVQGSGPASSIAAAISALGRALLTWEEPPPLGESGSILVQQLNAMADAIALVWTLVPEIPRQEIMECHSLVEQCHSPHSSPEKAYQASRGLMAKLMELGQHEDGRQDDLREAIAAVALPDDAELRKLSRYRKMLEEGLQRRLQALQQARALPVRERPSAERARDVKEYRLRLRVIV